MPRLAWVPARRAARALAAGLLDLALPCECVSCAGALDDLVGPTCSDCRARLLREAVASRCVECSAAVHDGGPRCGACAGPRALPVESPRTHAGVARDLVHALKYRRRLDAGDLLARVTADDPRVREALLAADLVVPVPADPVRRRERGFNPARLVGDGLVESLPGRRPRVRELLRLRRSRPQVGRSGAERRAAPRGSMTLGWAAWGVRGRRVVLVDDVVTTGATLTEAARVLERAGASSVVAIALTRAEGELVGRRARRRTEDP